MLPLLRVVAPCLCLLANAALAQDDPSAPNLLTLSRGAILVSADVDPTRALALTDGDHTSNWSAPTKRHPPPWVFVFELIAPATLSAVGIDGSGPRPGGIVGGSAGSVLVEASATGPEGGYMEIARLEAAEDGATLVDVATDPVRWLRFSVLSTTAPDAAYIYLDEVLAQGSLTPPDDADRFDGVFRLGRKDLIDLTQKDGAITGCYTENSGMSVGTLSGAMVDGVALLNWTSDQGIKGSALLSRDSTGGLSGVRYRHRSRSVWAGPSAEDGAASPCALPVVDPIVSALETDGVFTLYGIHFEVDSDVPKPSSLPAMRRLLSALQAAPDLSVAIEGHTDADGADAYNLDLSARRAASVVGWLVSEGIAVERLQPEGHGESAPVASNDTADGKALNRRVAVRRM